MTCVYKKARQSGQESVVIIPVLCEVACLKIAAEKNNKQVWLAKGL